MGKTKDLKLEKLPNDMTDDDKRSQPKVDLIKATISTRNPTELLTMYADARAAADDCKEKAADANNRVKAMWQLLFDSFEAANITSMHIKGVGKVEARGKVYSRVVDPVAFRQWCVENGFTEQLVLPWQTLNKLVTDMIVEEGKEPPPGVNAYIQNTPVLTREN